MCRALTPDHLSRERVFEEFTKLVLRGAAPSLGLRFLEHIGWLRFWPELETMIGVEQDPVWHPEGDVWPHTLHCLGCLRGPTHRRRRSRPHRRSRRALP
ncbi:MAG: hypothetical protein ACRDY7_03655 [Acidimicrobiia bacterium]